jgi:hypothetical protein
VSEVLPIEALEHDPENARVHTPRGHDMLVDVFKRVGAARSIVIDEHGVVLAGNGALDAAREAGITEVEVVDASPDALVAVKRTNLSEADKKFLALADNRTAELSLWDPNRLKALEADGVDLSQFWSADEFAAACHKVAEPGSVEVERPSAKQNRETVTEVRFDGKTIPVTDRAFAERAVRLISAWRAANGTTHGFATRLIAIAEEVVSGQA